MALKMNMDPLVSSSVTGQIKLILRIEGLLVLLASLLAYHSIEYSWKSFFILFFLPDIGFVGYLISSRFGAFTYNLLHSYILPMIIGITIWYYLNEICYLVLIWIAHIGFDRFLGYGLKYGSSFKFTHLGIIGNWGIKAKYKMVK